MRENSFIRDRLMTFSSALRFMLDMKKWNQSLTLWHALFLLSDLIGLSKEIVSRQPLGEDCEIDALGVNRGSVRRYV